MIDTVDRVTQRLNIDSAIQQALKRVSEVSPLQQFIAVNPLWDCIDESIAMVSEQLLKKTGSRMTLDFAEYIQHYQLGVIKSKHVQAAVAEFIDRQVDSDPVSLDNKRYHQKIISEYLCDPLMQAEVQQLVTEEPGHDTNHCYLLVSYQLTQYSYDEPLEEIKQECIKCLANFFQQAELPWQSPSPLKSFYAQWYEMMSYRNKAWRDVLAQIPTKALAAVEHLLEELSIPAAVMTDYIEQIVWQLKGWIGFIKWQQRYPNNPWRIAAIDVVDLLAIWLVNEMVWLKKLTSESCSSIDFSWSVRQVEDKLSEHWLQYASQTLSQHELMEQDFRWLWQRAYELSSQQDLIEQLSQQRFSLESAVKSQSQWIFCIDTRSEGLRRHLEAEGEHETFGFAGFFGFAYQLYDKQKGKRTNQCPAILEPALLAEVITEHTSRFASLQQGFAKSVKVTQKSSLSAFGLYEILGVWFALKLLAKNYCVRPLNRLLKRFKRKTSVKLTKQAPFCYEHAAELATGFLRSISLVDSFADIVVVCGHQAETTNNPYQAALDCGACGGNAGHSNAIVACEVLNHPEVRERLKGQDIIIPGSTHFIAASHHTTTDDIHWLSEVNELSDKLQQSLIAIQGDAVKAAKNLRKERLAMLPGDKDCVKRSLSWSELMPEWGLINNSALVIGPRGLTKTLDLKREVFLHSYDYTLDKTGELLKGIMLGPVLVAHWINLQYYFSSVDPDNFGAGNKAIHNVLSRVGVMEGNQSDLKIGLPQQSIFYQQQRLHQPRRLLVVIYAHKALVQRIINENATLRKLYTGQWVFFHVIEP